MESKGIETCRCLEADQEKRAWGGRACIATSWGKIGPPASGQGSSDLPAPVATPRALKCERFPSQILAFLHPLFDASFLTLLQHAPAHRVLRRLAQHLSPEIAFIDDVEQLRGPLEPFARAQAKALREGAGAARGVRKDTQQGDWRKKRKAAHEQTGMAVGVYQLEELVL